MKTPFKTLSIIVLGVSFAALASCGKQSSTSTATTSGSTIPMKVFLSERPANALKLSEVKASSQVGDAVVFEARVGGRVHPFVEGLAIFVTADPSLVSCDQRPDDRCPYPHDYCCEDSDALKAGTATIQIVNGEGATHPISAQGQGGIEPLKTLVIEGTVSEKDASGVFVVDATNIWVGTIPAGPSGAPAKEEG